MTYGYNTHKTFIHQEEQDDNVGSTCVTKGKQEKLIDIYKDCPDMC